MFERYTEASRKAIFFARRHLLRGLLREPKCLGARILLEHGAEHWVLADENVEAPKASPSPPADFRDLTAAARNGELGPVIGREHELDRIMQILSRRTRNNPVLVGESGVGKNAIVEGLVQRIAGGATPPLLSDRTVLAMDATALIAPQQNQQLLDFAQRTNAILYVHGLFDLAEKGHAWGVTETIHAIELFIASGRQCIATGTPLGLRWTWERASTLAQRFEVVPVLAPSEEQAIAMVAGAKRQYETFHGVEFGEGSIETAVSASRWFLRHRHLPDRAFDLIDEAGARVASRRRGEPGEKSSPGAVAPEDIVETVANRAGVPMAAVKSLLHAKEVERLESIVKELAAQIPGGGRDWIESLAAYLAGCSAEETERLAEIIRKLKTK